MDKLPQPYYQDEQATIYHADCRDILPLLEPGSVDCIITDPVWPNAAPELEGADRPWELFAEVARWFPILSARALVTLGCNSDPRILTGVPTEMPFFRVGDMEYVRPHYMGHLMYTGDILYAFGSFRVPTHIGKNVIPGRVVCTDRNGKGLGKGHPTPRKLDHVAWQVKWFTREGDLILDPFMGSGTTLQAAARAGRKSVGIEVKEEFCEIAVKRLAQGVLL